jgi:hypothetical protein
MTLTPGTSPGKSTTGSSFFSFNAISDGMHSTVTNANSAQPNQNMPALHRFRIRNGQTRAS